MNPQSTDKITEDTKALNLKIIRRKTEAVSINTSVGRYYQMYYQFLDVDIDQPLVASVFTVETESGNKVLYKNQGRITTNTYDVQSNGIQRITIGAYRAIPATTTALTAYIVLYSMRIEI